MDAPKTKIAIISFALGGGGAQRFAGLLSTMLENLGFEIHHITINEPQDYDYSGALLNLGRATKGQPAWKRKFTKGFLMRKYLKDHQIDTIIDNRPRNSQLREWVTRQIYGNRKVYYIVHSYNLKNYFPESTFLAKILYQKSEKIVCVSHAIEQEVKARYQFENTVTIYNPLILPGQQTETSLILPENFILYFGRFDQKVKNFSLMLDAFLESEIYKDAFRLLLIGEGPDLAFLKSAVAARNLETFVQIIPYQSDPFAIVRKARFTVLTSYFEGFPMSIVESLGCGTPVVSVDCQSGPSELIRNESNGLLVENHNIEALANAMKRLTENDTLYSVCKSNAVESVAHLSPEAISKKWAQILAR